MGAMRQVIKYSFIRIWLNFLWGDRLLGAKRLDFSASGNEEGPTPKVPPQLLEDRRCLVNKATKRNCGRSKPLAADI